MNILLFSFGLFVMGMGMANCNLVKGILSRINRYLINEDAEHLTAYGIMCFALVVLVTCLLNWEWF